MSHSVAATTRRTFTLYGMVLSLAVAIPLGALLVPDVDAEVNSGTATTSIR